MGAQWKVKGKAQAADARGKLFGRLAKDIMVAARSGADPASNSRLRLVLEQARKVSMPKDTLDRAIKKGAGLTGETVNFEHVIYEGFAPHRVPVMVECLTDNVNRTAPEMRVLFRKGQLGTSGSVAWDFDHVGMIEAEPAAAGADPELAAIEAGAQDFEPGEEAGVTIFITGTAGPRLHGPVRQAGLQAQEPDSPGEPCPGRAGRSRSLSGGHRCARRCAECVRGPGGLRGL
jgi:YebC/PmpR family DNA-binding regulatory protein